MERYANHPTLKAIRRDLRNHATPAEAALWKMLQKRGVADRKFRRQHSIGRYVLDFYCPAERLAIELDGGVHDDPTRAAYDAERQDILEAFGIQVLRFRNEEVLQTPDLVAAAIAEAFRPSE
ncbi:MAG: endonuclease domain-containing protein [Bacteroidota bacterium]